MVYTSDGLSLGAGAWVSAWPHRLPCTPQRGPPGAALRHGIIVWQN